MLLICLAASAACHTLRCSRSYCSMQFGGGVLFCAVWRADLRAHGNPPKRHGGWQRGTLQLQQRDVAPRLERAKQRGRVALAIHYDEDLRCRGVRTHTLDRTPQAGRARFLGQRVADDCRSLHPRLPTCCPAETWSDCVKLRASRF